MSYAHFETAVRLLGFDPYLLKLEFVSGGANNNVLGFAYMGTPWAVSVSFPKTNEISEQKLQSFQRLQSICAFLTERFRSGVAIDENDRFVFDGNCYLCDPISTKTFLSSLKLDSSFDFPELTYEGPFLVKKGAPASETLEYDLAFRTIMVQGLSILHRRTGLTKLVAQSTALEIAHEALSRIKDASEREMPDIVSKLSQKYQKKWNAANDREVGDFVIREMLLRSDATFIAMLNGLLDKHCVNSSDFRCFVHGDAHGANFIVVQQGDKREVHPIDVEDALGLTEDEKQHYLVDLVKFAISAYHLSKIFGKSLTIDAVIGEYYAAAVSE